MKTKLIDLSKEDTLFLKGVAIILIILSHLNRCTGGGSIGVNLFLIVSGYGLYKSYLKNNNKDYWKKKLHKVYIPFVIAGIFKVLYYVTHGNINPISIIFTLTGLDFNLIYDETMWYISYIFLEYLIFYLVKRIPSKKKDDNKNYLDFILLTIFNILIVILNIKLKFITFESGIHLYFLSFPLGILLAKLSNLKVKVKTNKILTFILSIVCLSLSFIFYKRVSSVYYINALYFALYTLPVSILFILFKIKTTINSKIINFIGEYSYYIFLWEGFLIDIKNIYFKNTLISNILLILIIILISYFYKTCILNQIEKNS